MSTAHTARRSTAAAIVAVAALLLTACAAGPIEPMTLTVATALPLTADPQVSDDEEGAEAPGRVPLTGSGPAAEAGVALAIQHINAAGVPLTAQASYHDAGAGDATLIRALAGQLGAANVVIGPNDPAQIQAVLAELTESKTLIVSPGDTTSVANTWEDAGLYWRTAAPETLQAGAIAERLPLGSIANLVIVTINDDRHKELVRAITSKVNAEGSRILEAIAIDPEAGIFFATADKALAWKGDGIIVLAGPHESGSLVDILLGAGYPADQITLVDENLVSYQDAPLNRSFAGVQGIAPRPQLPEAFQQELREAYVALHPELAETDPDLTVLGDLRGAAEAYDAVVTAALAAMAARSVQGDAIAGKLIEVTTTREGAVTCTSFAACAKLLIDGQQIDYNGVTGGIAFGRDRTPTEFTIPTFVYSKDRSFSVVVEQSDDGSGGDSDEATDATKD